MHPKVNYGLWPIIMYECRIINCKKCTTLVGGGGVEASMCGGRGYMGNLYLPLNFPVNLKLLQKLKSVKKKKRIILDAVPRRGRGLMVMTATGRNSFGATRCLYNLTLRL